jgi:hypothetical protein
MRSPTPFLVLAAGMLAALLTGCAARYDGEAVEPLYAEPGSTVDGSWFYDDLQQYGRWFDHPSYGWCWTPFSVDPYWRPYTIGRWTYTDYGWTWLSDLPWGWAPFHYGRWAHDLDYGWLWVPDTVWGPAWVVWQGNDHWIGWAPLPPGAVWQPDIGVRYRDRPPQGYWSFVPRDAFLDRQLRDEVVSVARNEPLLKETRELRRIAVRDGRPVDPGPDDRAIAAATGRPLVRRRVVDAPAPVAGGHVRGDEVAMYRLPIKGPPRRIEPPLAARGRIEPPDERIQEEMRRQRRELDRRTDEERARMKRRHEQEDRAPGREGAAERDDRQRQEKRALEQYDHEQRRIIEERARHRIVPPAATEPPHPPASREPAPRRGSNSQREPADGRRGG